MSAVLVVLLFGSTLGSSFNSFAQSGDETKIARVDIKHIGQFSISEEIIRANIRSRAGDVYRAVTVDDDIRSLYSTQHFYDVRVTKDRAEDGGIIITFVIQPNPRLTEAP